MTRASMRPKQGPRPRGRRPGPSTTRGEVLTAAREAFAELGFGEATIREIARRADVDPALVIQLFESKEGLFVAAMQLPFEPRAVVDEVAGGPRSHVGERMVLAFLRLWDDPEIGPRMLALIRSAATHPAAAKRLRELVVANLLRPIAEAVSPSEPLLRGQLVGSHLVGLGFNRYILGVEPLASASPELLCRWIAPTIQRYLTGPDPGPKH